MSTCSSCQKEFTKQTLNKNDGLCGRCSKNNEEKRPTISKDMRSRIWMRDCGDVLNSKCYVCKGKMTSINFEVGHIISFKNKGKTSDENLKAICQTCNRSMGSKNMEEYKKERFPNEMKENIEVKQLKNWYFPISNFLGINACKRILNLIKEKRSIDNGNTNRTILKSLDQLTLNKQIIDLPNEIRQFVMLMRDVNDSSNTNMNQYFFEFHLSNLEKFLMIEQNKEFKDFFEKKCLEIN